jgi:hypothetical protein
MVLQAPVLGRGADSTMDSFGVWLIVAGLVQRL